MDYLNIGAAPGDETPVQVSDREAYYEPMMKEAHRYAEMLRKRFPVPDGVSARFAVKTFPHDFGPYAEVVVWYDDKDSTSAGFAYFVENNSPAKWTDTEVLSYEEFLKTQAEQEVTIPKGWDCLDGGLEDE